MLEAGRSQDASTTVPEAEWYFAKNDWGYLDDWCRKWDRRGAVRDLVCLDVFSASRGFQTAFEELGHRAASYDVKTDERCDITTKSGFLVLLALGLQSLV